MSNSTELFHAAEQGDLKRVRELLDQANDLVHLSDPSGATALHYAAFYGHREVVELLIDRGADINCTDGQHHATPAGWAIEYLRERGGFLALELNDFAYAIEVGDVRWAARFLARLPALRHARDTNGKPFLQLAQESNNPQIIALFR